MAATLFGPALDELSRRESDGSPWTEPRSWIEYCEANGLGTRSTAQHISLQHRDQLVRELADANAMLLRVGRGTFSLVRASGSVDAFFLHLPERNADIETFLPELTFAEWYQFHLLGSLIEANAVQLAIATGLLGHALNLDRPWPRVTPATSHSSWRFSFRPLSARPDCVLGYEGQVEIDAAFLARRRGRWCFFVVEAKHSEKPYALAKHKLLFAMHALASREGSGGSGFTIPADVPFVPLFLRSWSDGGTAMFEVAECAEVRSDALIAIDGLMPTACRTFGVPLRFG